MRTPEMPEETFIMKDKDEAMRRYYHEARDVWQVITDNAIGKRIHWVETGSLTHTLKDRDRSRAKAAQAVETTTGQRVVHVEYDP